MLTWYLVLEPTARTGGADPLVLALSLAYPVGDLVVLFGVTLVLLHSRDRSPAALRILLAGVALFVVADIAYARLSLRRAFRRCPAGAPGP
ncbi:MAG TPA: hypothetical protein VFO65_12125 [Acidimicrobiales bacterium]|nr:hypothetical protein [Acidimicrobiales bacterium]